MARYVYDFIEGNKDLKDLLGGKGANLAEMTRMGLPVPPGFTITTEACREYLRTGALPDGLLGEVEEHLRLLQNRMGKNLGDPADPLLLSVRSGGKFSMPGMMETILDIGLNDLSVLGLAAQSGDARFAWDSYRRLIQMFGRTVFDVPGEDFESFDAQRAGVAELQDLVASYKKAFQAHTGRVFPQAAHEQLYLAVASVFKSWNAERAVLYRRQERIPHDLGTAVNVMAMVFGNRGPDSGTGVAFTRDPATGRRGVYGDYLRDAQGEDVVAGIRNTVGLDELGTIDPASFTQLRSIMQRLEQRYHDLCDIEFTIENGKLWMLQTRVGKRTPAAAFVIGALFNGPMVIWGTLLQRRVPPALLGRVSSLDFFVSLVFMPISMALAGPVSTAIGLAPTFMIAGLLPVVFAVAAVLWARMPADELAHPLDDPEPDSEKVDAV